MTQVYRTPPKNFSPAAIAVGCYLGAGNRYLWLRKARGLFYGTWGIPGGKVAAGESVRDALFREVKEETGLILDGGILKEVAPLYAIGSDMPFTFHVFHYECKEIPHVQLSDEHDDYCWMAADELDKLPLIPGGKEALDHFLELQLLGRN